MIGQLPPFAIASPVFRFRALAQHAGRAALGGDREVALACFGVARLAAGMLPPFTLIPADSAARVANTRQWLASLNLPHAARTAAGSAIEAIGASEARVVAHAIERLMHVAAPQIDQSSMAELRELVAELNQH